MNYCKNCGAKLNDGDLFCQNCGMKVDNVETNKDISFQNNFSNNKKSKKNVGTIVRYCFGGILILCALTELPKLSGFLGILAGLSLMPFIYKLLKEKRNFEFKGMQIIIPIILIFLFGLSLPSVDTEESEKNDNDKTSTTEVEQDSEGDTAGESLEEKWRNYYKDNNIEIIEVDSSTLYTYGKYYKEKTVLTGVEIADISTTSIKAKVGDSDSIFFSFVFNFDDKNEIKKYKEGNKVVIVGEVSSNYSSTSKTVTLDKCHILLSNDDAQNKINELLSNQSKYVEYAKGLEAAEKQAEADKIVADKNAYISKCEVKDYQDILRNPNSYKKQYIKVSGKVIQVTNGWFNSVTIRLEDSSSNVWYISYTYADDNETKILYGDNISVYGQSTGTTSYTTITGSQVTIPSIDAEYININ